jgi:hypothetical protein
VHKTTANAAGVSGGKRVEVTTELDDEPLRTDTVPHDLLAALARDRKAATSKRRSPSRARAASQPSSRHFARVLRPGVRGNARPEDEINRQGAEERRRTPNNENSILVLAVGRSSAPWRLNFPLTRVG